MNGFLEYIQPELLVTIPVLVLIGWLFKKSGWFDTKHIPAVLAGSGILLALLFVFGAAFPSGPQDWATAIFTAIVQGVLCAGTAVFANQIYKQEGGK